MYVLIRSRDLEMRPNAYTAYSKGIPCIIYSTQGNRCTAGFEVYENCYSFIYITIFIIKLYTFRRQIDAFLV